MLLSTPSTVKDILIKINAIEAQIDSLEKKLPKLLELNRKRLKKRACELAIQIDRDRLDQEMVLLANRSDIDEEIGNSHQIFLDQ